MFTNRRALLMFVFVTVCLCKEFFLIFLKFSQLFLIFIDFSYLFHLEPAFLRTFQSYYGQCP